VLLAEKSRENIGRNKKNGAEWNKAEQKGTKMERKE
jgi:hypothetical protein